MNCNAKRHPALKYTIRALQAPHYNLHWTEHFQDAVNSTKLHFTAVQQCSGPYWLDRWSRVGEGCRRGTREEGRVHLLCFVAVDIIVAKPRLDTGLKSNLCSLKHHWGTTLLNQSTHNLSFWDSCCYLLQCIISFRKTIFSTNGS